MLFFRGQAYQQKDWTLEKKMESDMQLLDEVNSMYKLVNKLFIICIRKNLKLIMENPYSEEHFLRRYWCFPAAVIDKDRRQNGDYYPKPTQFWFLNTEPTNNLIMEAPNDNSIGCSAYKGDSWRDRRKKDWEKTGAKDKKTSRSMIHPDYANRFIRQFII